MRIMHRNSAFIKWIQRVFYSINYILLIGFAAVLPIDCIAQASTSSNNALNTFIVVGALVAFAIVCLVIIGGRSLYFRSCLQDIPRRYIPISPADLPHSQSRKLILRNMNNSKDLASIFKKPHDPVIHPGIEPPKSCDDPSIQKIFPEYLNYGVCIKNIADRLKFKGRYLNVSTKSMPKHYTFADFMKADFITNNENENDVKEAQKLIKLYEYVRYSGQNVTREQFFQFIQLTSYVMERKLLQNDTTLDITHLGSENSNNFEISSRDFPLSSAISRVDSYTSGNRNATSKANDMFISKHLNSLNNLLIKSTTNFSGGHERALRSIKTTTSLHSGMAKTLASDTNSFDTVIHH